MQYLKGIFIVLVVHCFFTASIYAQAPRIPDPTLTSSNNGGGGAPAPTGVPVDGGLVLLATAGVAYGSKRLMKNKSVKKL